MLSGDNGILQRAAEAKTNTDNAQIKEKVQLAYLAAMAGGKGEVTEALLEDALDSEFGSGKYTLAQDLSKVTIDGKDYYFDGTTGDDGGETQSVADLRADAITNGVTALSDTGTTTIKDNKDNEIKVPKGFGIAIDSGVNIAEGIVIEDADSSRSTYGSQFVWVPVGTITKTDGSTETIPLARGTFNKSTGAFTPVQTQTGTTYTASTSSSVISSYFYEFANDTESQNATYGNTKAKNLSGFVESALSNGGYYIARYEAGVKGTTASSTATTYTISGSTFTKNSTTANSIVTTSGVGVWNQITQTHAATVCQSMYSDVNSDLVNSYAWDAVIVFIQKCGSNSNYANKTRLQSILTTTGNASDGTNNDVQCKIYDMAGNVREWTTETNTTSGADCVGRGGNYSGAGYWTAIRFSTNTTGTDKSIGFRPLLYL